MIKENISLKKLNTFGIDVSARYFAEFATTDELLKLLDFEQPQTANNKLQTLILGGGSNLLFTNNYNGLVLKNEIKGIKTIKEDEHHVYVQVGAGENWHGFVTHCIANNWAGVENLSLIPGNTGASPMQNIGAYGVEIKDVFHSLEAIHCKEKKLHSFSVNDCEFGYRESVFKRKLKGEFVITHVTYRLNKIPSFNISYGTVEMELEKMNVKELSIKAISDAIVSIRSSKLPDPQKIGNAGSFFKNPHVSAEKYQLLRQQFARLVGYVQENGDYKLAAGWLIENTGPEEGVSWKGYRRGDAGCHAWQSLVLVNYGNAAGQEIYDLSEEILQSVHQKFGITLEREVNIT